MNRRNEAQGSTGRQTEPAPTYPIQRHLAAAVKALLSGLLALGLRTEEAQKIENSIFMALALFVIFYFINISDLGVESIIKRLLGYRTMEEKISRIEGDIIAIKEDMATKFDLINMNMATKDDIRVLFAEELAKIIGSRGDQPPTTNIGQPTVKATMHQAQHISHCPTVEDPLLCQRTDASIGQGCSHHANG